MEKSRVQLSLDEMLEIVSEVGCCIAGQTEALCPADRLMYAARDVTSTVGSLGLIVSSIISKKAAEGINTLVLDVKWGSGCYQETLQEAESLADALVKVILVSNWSPVVCADVGVILPEQDAVHASIPPLDVLNKLVNCPVSRVSVVEEPGHQKLRLDLEKLFICLS